MGRPLERPVVATFVLAGAVALAPAALAGDPPRIAPDDAGNRAHTRYDAGTQAFAQSRFVEAALDFEAAASEKPSAVALYTAGLSWERANVPQRAADDYTRALAIGGLPAESSSQATQRISTLEGILGTVVVTAPEGWRAQIDSDTELPLPATFHETPGVHSLTVRAPGRPVDRLSVALQAGATSHLSLPLPPPPPRVHAEESAPARGPDSRQAVGFVALGAGVATLLGGVLLGIEALDARDTYQGSPTPRAYDHARNLEIWTDVAWIAGGTLLAGGVVLVIWPAPRPPASASASGSQALGVVVGPASVGLRGAF